MQKADDLQQMLLVELRGSALAKPFLDHWLFPYLHKQEDDALLLVLGNQPLLDGFVARKRSEDVAVMPSLLVEVCRLHTRNLRSRKPGLVQTPLLASCS